MVKVGGVRWKEEIGGVESALREAGVGFCDGRMWLVGEEELDKRRKRGSLASTMVVRVKGEGVERQLNRAGLWVGGYWCSVKRFVAAKPRRREAGWMKVVDTIRGDVEVVLDEGKDRDKREEREKEKRGIALGQGVGLGKVELKDLGDKLEKLEKLILGLGRELARKKGDWTREDDRREKRSLISEEEEVKKKEKQEKRDRVSVFMLGMEWKPSGPGLFG